MKLVVLAAGHGNRLLPYTRALPKCLLPFAGKPLIEHLLATAHRCGISDIVIVRGPGGDKIRYDGVVYYDETEQLNMVHSLFCAMDDLCGDVIVSYSDIVYTSDVLRSAMDCAGDVCVVVDTNWQIYYQARTQNAADIAESLEIGQGRITEIGQPIADGQLPTAQYIGLIKFSGHGITQLCETYTELRDAYKGMPWRNAASFEVAYLTDLLQEMIERGSDVRPVLISGGWLEFDTAEDYERALSWVETDTLHRFMPNWPPAMPVE